MHVLVLARRMVDVSMIDALLCFTVGRGRLGTVNKEETSPAGGQAKDLQLQKVSVVGFSLQLVLLRCLHVAVE